MRLNPREFSRNFDLPLGLKVNLCPTPNFPFPFKFALLFASLSIHKLLPSNVEAIIFKVDRLAIFGIGESKRLAKDDLGARVLARWDDIAHEEVSDGKLMLVVDRHLGCVGGGVGDFGEGAPVRFDGFGGTGISDFGGGVVSKGALEIVAGVDVL